MNEKIFLAIFVFLVFPLSFFIFNIDKTLAYAEFDKSGKYVCNPFARSLETNIYIDTVHKINDKMTLYLKTNPNSTMLQQHDVMMQDQKTWNLYNASRTCISDVIGANPDDIVSLTTNVQQAITVPEFGLFSPLVMMITILGSIIAYRKFF